MKKLTKMVNLIWRSVAINPDDAWIWYEVSKTLYTQMGSDLRIGLAQGTDLLGKLEVGAGASVALWGYRVALLLTGWIAFVLADSPGGEASPTNWLGGGLQCDGSMFGDRDRGYFHRTQCQS